MGNSEETKPSKPDQANNIHVYPDWAAVQAFYGARVVVPPYFNSAVASGHAPHPYMWGPPQQRYDATLRPFMQRIYAHGGAAIPNMETPTKSSGNTDQGLVKKLKEFDGLAMSLGNGNADLREELTLRVRRQKVLVVEVMKIREGWVKMVGKEAARKYHLLVTPSLLVVLSTNRLFITSKSKVRIDVEKVKPYYLSLIEKVSTTLVRKLVV
ncbi:Common plant regulatory factor 1 [Camellia lanceoleosa]|uniref:Common plant regulatory factor 1 n=1 Tax=Camellia lanceoleosa TaxID=1840588 RepID=A0ACC0FB01_9ERIC|nr:Common plant regulatory factor 1 [Camellia lanceoleosa]